MHPRKPEVRAGGVEAVARKDGVGTGDHEAIVRGWL